MTDILTPKQRSRLMSKVHNKNTKPELILRSALHRIGFRYTLNNRCLAGNPDLVLKKYSTAIFVHGCFWHFHAECPKASIPKSNREFWSKKLKENVERDTRNRLALEELGWEVIVVWECELYNETLETIERVVNLIKKHTKPTVKDYTHLNSLDRRDLLNIAEKKVRYRIDKGKQGK